MGPGNELQGDGLAHFGILTFSNFLKSKKLTFTKKKLNILKFHSSSLGIN
jgi:hypothetical protein